MDIRYIYVYISREIKDDEFIIKALNNALPGVNTFPKKYRFIKTPLMDSYINPIREYAKSKGVGVRHYEFNDVPDDTISWLTLAKEADSRGFTHSSLVIIIKTPQDTYYDYYLDRANLYAKRIKVITYKAK